MNKKILIFEDELLIAKVMMMQFQRKEFEVHHSMEGEKGLEMAIQIKPDIIIMDVQLLNKASGIDVATKIRKAKIDAPIIFTTGNSFSNTVEHAATISNSLVLSKPIEFEHLLSEVKKLIC
jgi:two-component system alkaline phosphatase synthesis response regulator PhoP